jgi:mono/diheme cytochrome c family protein
MKCLFQTLMSLLVVMLLAQPALADSANGKKLHNEECVRCHGSEIYTRKNRKVQSLGGLDHQVGVCISVVGVTWFDEEKQDVVDYLNQNFYKFK